MTLYAVRFRKVTERSLDLLEDENHRNAALEEAVLFQSAPKLRELFVVAMAFCHTTNLPELRANTL